MNKVFAIFFALVLFGSNIGLGMGTHYCGGSAVKTQLFIGHAHLDCGMETTENSPISCENNLKPTNCCENQVSNFDIEEDYQSHFSYSKIQLASIVLLKNYLFEFRLNQLAKSTNFPYYNPPPLLSQDSYVLNQVFLL